MTTAAWWAETWAEHGHVLFSIFVAGAMVGWWAARLRADPKPRLDKRRENQAKPRGGKP